MPKTPIKYPETISASMPAGTRERLDKLRGQATRGEYVRELLEEALKRKESVPEFNARTPLQRSGCSEWVGSNPNACDGCGENYWRHPESMTRDWGE